MTKSGIRINDEARRTKIGLFGFRHSDLIRISGFVILVLPLGCTSSHPTTQPTTASQRQDAAMRDPFGYKPDMSDSNTISGDGDVGHYDRKAMRKDLNDVFNP
jgi:hypothetical protein